jgi:hypothetical protein
LSRAAAGAATEGVQEGLQVLDTHANESESPGQEASEEAAGVVDGGAGGLAEEAVGAAQAVQASALQFGDEDGPAAELDQDLSTAFDMVERGAVAVMQWLGVARNEREEVDIQALVMRPRSFGERVLAE